MFPNQNDQDKDDDDDETNIIRFQTPYDHPHQQDQDNDLIMGQTVPLLHNQVMTSLPLNNINHDINESKTSCDYEKKIVRRDNERQRRQHLAILHSSLRSHLPFHLIKGNRSLSDHINAATDYVQQMKTKIEDLQVKRNKLKSGGDLGNWIRAQNYSSSNSDSSTTTTTTTTTGLNYSFTIQPCLGSGVEIVICSSNLLPLSRVLNLLLQQGIDVSNCTTTNVNGRFIHTIHSTQVEDHSCIDMSELQQKLNFMFNSEIPLY